MSNTAKKKKPTADEIAQMAMSGKDISRYFTNKGEMRPPVKRVNLTIRSKVRLSEGFAEN